MSNLRKRVCAIVLSVVMCLSLLPMSASAVVKSSDNWYGIVTGNQGLVGEQPDLSGTSVVLTKPEHIIYFFENFDKFKGKTVSAENKEYDLGGYQFNKARWKYELYSNITFLGNSCVITNFRFTNVNAYNKFTVSKRSDVDSEFAKAETSTALAVHGFFVAGTMSDVTFKNFNSDYSNANGADSGVTFCVEPSGSMNNVTLERCWADGGYYSYHPVPSSFVYV